MIHKATLTESDERAVERFRRGLLVGPYTFDLARDVELRAWSVAFAEQVREGLRLRMWTIEDLAAAQREERVDQRLASLERSMRRNRRELTRR